jgi:hypothetical protein
LRFAEGFLELGGEFVETHEKALREFRTAPQVAPITGFSRRGSTVMAPAGTGFDVDQPEAGSGRRQ